MSVLLLTPNNRKKMHSYIFPQERHVLATLDFALGVQEYRAVKIEDEQNILVEIYKINTNKTELIHKFTAKNTRDVFYDYDSKTSTSNLFSANIDKDEFIEIVVPVLDKNLVSRLNIIKYNPSDQSFSYYGY